MTSVGFLGDGRPFTAKMIGSSRAELSTLCRAGLVRRVLRSVYVDARVTDDVLTRAQAVALVLPPGAVIARRTAGWLWGVDAFARDERHRALVVECIDPRHPTLRRPGVRAYVAELDPSDVTEILGLPVTTGTRTAADLLRYLPANLALGAADALTHLGRTTPEEIRSALAPLVGYRNIRQARRLCGFVEPATESFGESFLRLRMIDAGFPRPVVQIELTSRSGVVVWRLDLGWPDVKLALEYDGAQDHTDPEDVAHDGERRAAVTKQYGWTVVPVTGQDVFGPSMALEHKVGTILGISPIIGSRPW